MSDIERTIKQRKMEMAWAHLKKDRMILPIKPLSGIPKVIKKKWEDQKSPGRENCKMIKILSVKPQQLLLPKKMERP